MTQEITKLLDSNNKKYKHYAYLPSLEEFNSYHHGTYNLFKTNKSIEERFLFSAKDIFNTYDFPTQMGSLQWKGFNAGNNARVISDLLNVGDRLVGKTTTSEFAVHEETDVINPWDEKRTVGTSSAGAPISILIDKLDFALGTQTGGSIGRPASYCGVSAIKPTYGLIPRTGILKTCDPFDTVGFFSKNLNIMEKVLKSVVKIGNNYPINNREISNNIAKEKPIVGILSSNKLEISPEADNKLSEIKLSLDPSQYDVVDVTFPEFVNEIHKMHELIYAYSLSYYFSKELEHPEKVSASFKNYIKIGELLKADDFIDLIKKHEDYISKYDDWIKSKNIDYIIYPSTANVAPLRNDIEPIDINLIYTFTRVPVIYLPLGFNKTKSLPFGISISSFKYNDFNLINFSKDFEKSFINNEGNSPI
jgi:Asp-tRNA(Asn)/Glu-tRNA(Gln) amidotransferase A subunit family amidase